MKQKSIESANLRQYILVGAGLGLYFGWFFRPMTEPTFSVVITLSVLITIVMTLLRLFKRDRENLLRRTIVTFFQYAAVLAILQARHYAFDFGGRTAVIIMTTFFGALSGYIMARRGITV